MVIITIFNAGYLHGYVVHQWLLSDFKLKCIFKYTLQYSEIIFQISQMIFIFFSLTKIHKRNEMKETKIEWIKTEMTTAG